MSGRSVHLVDRLLAVLLALMLLGAGALGLWWWSGRAPRLPPVADRLGDLVATTWWPWASVAVGLVLVCLGARWVLVHLVTSGIDGLRLDGSDGTGTLVVESSGICGAAAAAFASTPDVHSARGGLTRDRGQLVARVRAVVDARADLADLAARADTVSAELSRALGRPDLRCRFELRVARRSSTRPPRVS